MIVEDSEIENNSHLLSKYDSVVYFDNKENVQEIMFGSFQSYFLPNLSEILINLDEEKIKNLIRKSDTKSPEVLLYRILNEGNIYKKNREVLEINGNKFGVFDGQVENNLNPWSIPFYDKKNNHIYFIVWNTKIEKGIEIQVMVNKSKIYHIENTEINHWKLIDLGD